MSGGIALYSAVDDVVTQYTVDIEAATLTEMAKTRVPAKVQYGWAHPTLPCLYLSTSTGGPRVPVSDNHLCAYDVGHDGTLTARGEPVPLQRRAVHMCIDPHGRFALNGHNFPSSSITVHRIEAGGSIGTEIAQTAPISYGIYPHQVMVFPSGNKALIVDRGNKAQGEKSEDPGALRSFGFTNGELSAGQTVAPGGGYGFGARHIDFHPSLPCLYASDERTNKMYAFRYRNDVVDSEPAYTLPTLAEPLNTRPRQIAGPIHVHPAGKCVYVANRADHGVAYGSETVFGGGENNIAVYAIDPDTGEPKLVQHADTHSFHVRTFACDPSGRILVAASIKSHRILEGDTVRPVAAALSVFRIEKDGKLTFVRKYDVPTTGTQLQYWMGMVPLKS